VQYMRVLPLHFLLPTCDCKHAVPVGITGGTVGVAASVSVGVGGHVLQYPPQLSAVHPHGQPRVFSDEQNALQVPPVHES